MRAQCVSRELTPQQSQLLGGSGPTTEYEVTPGRTYLILGLTFVPPSSPHAGGTMFEIVNDSGLCLGVPAALFEINDPRCSRHWAARQLSGGALALWPPQFFTPYFHDDLSEGVRSAIEGLRTVVATLEGEFADAVSGTDFSV